MGHNFAPNWSGEINFNKGSFEIPGTGAKQALAGYSADVLYKFLPDSVFRPYVLAGGGLLNDKISGGNMFHTYLAEAGAGGVTNTMTAKGYGKDHPIADNKTADGRLQNRRVSLRIVGGQ